MITSRAPVLLLVKSAALYNGFSTPQTPIYNNQLPSVNERILLLSPHFQLVVAVSVFGDNISVSQILAKLVQF